jgi:hypothetical protein
MAKAAAARLGRFFLDLDALVGSAEEKSAAAGDEKPPAVADPLAVGSLSRRERDMRERKGGL